MKDYTSKHFKLLLKGSYAAFIYHERYRKHIV